MEPWRRQEGLELEEPSWTQDTPILLTHGGADGGRGHGGRMENQRATAEVSGARVELSASATMVEAEIWRSAVRPE